jgi:hypothetical protein
MLNYDDLVIQANERQSAFRAAVKQRRWEQSLDPTQPHPIFLWVGHKLIALGRQLQGEGQVQGFHPSPALLSR